MTGDQLLARVHEELANLPAGCAARQLGTMLAAAS
jgi:hypothetical protein